MKGLSVTNIVKHRLMPHSWYPADTKTLPRRRKNVLILVSKTFWIGLKWKSRWPFFKMSSRRLLGDALKTSSRRHPQDVYMDEMPSRCLPGDVLKTPLRRLKTSRLSVKCKGPPGDYMNFLSRYVSNYLHITTPSLDKQIELIWIN